MEEMGMQEGRHDQTQTQMSKAVGRSMQDRAGAHTPRRGPSPVGPMQEPSSKGRGCRTRLVGSREQEQGRREGG